MESDAGDPVRKSEPGAGAADKNSERDKDDEGHSSPNISSMDALTCEKIVSHTDQQDCELNPEGLENNQTGVEKQEDAREGGRQYADRRDDHKSFVSFRSVAQQKAGCYQRAKENEVENLKREKTERRRPSRRSEATLGRLHRHDPAESEHRDNDGGAGVAKLLVNANPLCGNQRGLRYQENQPTGKYQAVEDEERWQMKLGKEAVEKKSSRESGENDCGGKNGDEKIEAAVAKTRG